ncbi:CsbD family protein [Williamsia sp.]|uniref:CsbD family protein n=1 Tax=Williamsia sp. TaxID=1872085 RepID=UPI002F94776B
MGISDDAKNKAEDLKGRGKEAAGSLSGDDQLKAEGQGDQASAGVKQKVTDAADAVKHKADEVKDKLTGR